MDLEKLGYSLAISLVSIYDSTVWGAAVGMACGTLPSAIVGAVILA